MIIVFLLLLLLNWLLFVITYCILVNIILIIVVDCICVIVILSISVFIILLIIIILLVLIVIVIWIIIVFFFFLLLVFNDEFFVHLVCQGLRNYFFHAITFLNDSLLCCPTLSINFNDIIFLCSHVLLFLLNKLHPTSSTLIIRLLLLINTEFHIIKHMWFPTRMLEWF